LKILILALVVCMPWTLSAQAQLSIGDKTAVEFATVEEGTRILGTADDFSQRMSPFDRSLRMRKAGSFSEQEFLAYAGSNVMAWSDAEREGVTAAFRNIQPQLEALSLKLPQVVHIIKTSGLEEGGAAYTRANAIIIPEAILGAPPEEIERLICHELFHVMSRGNPELREKLYQSIGFEYCGEVPFPAQLLSRKMTNPDAPRNDHCIQVKFGNNSRWAVPILYSDVMTYDPERGGEILEYLQFKIMLVDWPDKAAGAIPSKLSQGAELLGLSKVSGFFEQVGRNTGYIIHPEEILADNFVLLVRQKSDIPSPAIVTEMGKIMNEGD